MLLLSMMQRKEDYRQTHTEVQRISFVGYTGGEGGSPSLWNLQNLRAVPPYEAPLGFGRN